jgi:puromycin-sensitive aminopeptidase
VSVTVPFTLQAVFKITLEVPSETVALSNMPVVEEKVNGPTKTVYFQETPIMSTYLVAVIVGIFDYVEAFTSDGIITSLFLILPSHILFALTFL